METYEVFLSYHWRDHPHVETIAHALRERELNVFLDRWYLHPGRPWPQELEKVMRSCKAVAVFVGPGEMGPWQQREMNMALERQAKERDFPVIPLLLPSSDPVLGFLGQNTWVDFRTTPDDPKLIAILASAIRGEPPGPDARNWIQETVATICPYRGLLYFREEDASFFFGRGKAIDQLVKSISVNSFLAVVGASGSGKSSVVRAGLVPALRRNREKVWEMVTLVPGDRPLRSLAVALAPLLEPEMTETDRLVEINKLSGALASGDLKLRDIVERVLSKQLGTERLLIVVDQWEELYSLTPDETTRRCFIDELLDASTHMPVSVVLTLRGDFVGHALAYRPLSDRLQGGQINLGPMNRDELTLAITKPAEKVGLKFEPGLVKRILDDAGDEPGNLPLLEFVLKQLWDHRNRGLLLHDAYDNMGRLQGAVAKKADELFAKLSPLEQQAVQRIFLQLATPAEEGDYTRRRASFTEIGEPSMPVVKRLTDERLLVTSPGTAGGEETVELSHEALIRSWDKLKGWLNEDREFLLWRRRLSEFFKAWQRSTETDKEGTLLRGTFLVEAEKWLGERSERLPENERKYIDDSIALKNREREAEQKRQERELKRAQNLAEEQKLRANEQEKSRRRTQLFLIAVCAFALLAGFYGYSSQKQKRIAENQGKANRQLLYVANMNLADKAFEEGSPSNGHEILNRYLPTSAIAQQDDARSFYWYFLWRMNHQELATLKGHEGIVSSVAFSPDEKTLASS